jgi:hypothetical protein
MAHKFSKTFWCFSLTSLCLVIGSALWGVQTAAQTSNAAHGDNSGSDAAKKNEFKFEVVSIKPVKPESSLSDENWDNTNPSPDGYRSSTRITQMIMVAYGDTVGGDAWIFTPLLNLPTWSEDWYDIDARVSNSDLAAWQNQSSKHELLRSAM